MARSTATFRKGLAGVWHGIRVRGCLAIRRAPCRSRTPGALQCAIPLPQPGLEPLAGITVAITDARTTSPPVTLDSRANGIICNSIPCGGHAASVLTRAAELTVGTGQTGLRARHRPLDPMELGRHPQRTRSCTGGTCYVSVRIELNGRRLALAVEVATHLMPVLASPRKAQGTALPSGNASRTARNGVAQALRALFRIQSRQPLVTTPLGRYDSSVPGRAVLTRLSVGSRETFPVGDAPRP